MGVISCVLPFQALQVVQVIEGQGVAREEIHGTIIKSVMESVVF